MNKKKLKNDLIYIFIRLLVFNVRLMPRQLSLFTARLLSKILWILFRKEREKTLRNLQSVFGTSISPDLTGRKVFSNIAENLVDAILLQKRLKNNPEEAMQIEGLDYAKEALAKGKGIIFLTAHTGCFEMLSPRFAQIGFPLTVMGAKIYDPRLNSIIIDNRKSFNVGYIERGDDIRALVRLLRNGGCFGVLCDLDTRAESRFVPFFGTPAKTISGPFRLALKTGSAPLPIFAIRNSDGSQTAKVYPPLIPEGATEEDKIHSMMSSYNKILEDLIKRDPSQWIWMHERWKSKL
ncbi:MAG: lysophospholipid acyltransferase family protein [Fibrobacteres bacterium]|nr:lysophospholipid acyltransferase family protein [Fibrobacterota bacterium]